MALQDRKLGEHFRRAHQGTLAEHTEAAKAFWSATLQELERTEQMFNALAKQPCNDTQFNQVVETLLPIPARPRNADQNPGLLKAWKTRTETINQARTQIQQSRGNGKGMDMDSANGTYWGALNAITEYVDHHHALKDGSRLAYALLGDGMDLKVKALHLIQERCDAAA